MEIINVLLDNGFDLADYKGFVKKELYENMNHDKKSAQIGIKMVMIDGIGSVVPFGGDYCDLVTEKEVLKAFDWVYGKLFSSS